MFDYFPECWLEGCVRVYVMGYGGKLLISLLSGLCCGSRSTSNPRGQSWLCCCSRLSLGLGEYRQYLAIQLLHTKQLRKTTLWTKDFLMEVSGVYIVWLHFAFCIYLSGFFLNQVSWFICFYCPRTFHLSVGFVGSYCFRTLYRLWLKIHDSWCSKGNR